ncbi:MAG TPA: exonuclease SbcCD subunit D [Aggregatilinea sp.]|uniref:metallophosphoesterase family protein n=1 Tax=Aggregatilinea sp. TaxID=2806333 RepID=UPI002CA888DA|nr:exonuclease SbcCD subunit D [Aggregatilinea sp.]HML21764.1 exonuclease SbcCD subunit D [Aggregatilinea sp.]
MTDPIRMLHFADVHVGMENYGRTDPSTGLSSRVVDFLRRMDEMVDYAVQHDADLVIFAGDAFKSRNPTPTFQREFAWRIQDLAKQCPVVMLVGNHDLPTIDKRASSIEIYETLNVPNTILGREYRTYTVETKRGPVLVGTAPYPLRGTLLRDAEIPHNSTIGEIDGLMEQQLDLKLQALASVAADADMPRVLTGHFTVTGAVWGSERSVMLGRDVQVLLSTVADPAWDYVALGHIHKHQNLTLGRTDAPPVIYSGSLERIDFGEERDPKGFLWVELARGATSYKFVEVDCRPFITLRVDVKGKGDPTGAVLDDIARHDLRDAIVRVIVKADPEAELLLQDRPIQQALYDAGVNHVAAIQRDVERPSRMRLGAAPEGMTPEQLLERYLLTKDLPQDRIDVLLDHAREIFDGGD